MGYWRIHERAVVSAGAQLGQGVDVGPFAFVDDGVTIGDGTIIEPGAVIYAGTTIGSNCRIGSGACLGGRPQDRTYKGEKTTLKIGDNNDIREHVTMHRGTVEGGSQTVVGDGCLFMAYSHVAHDCHVGNGVTMVNGAQLAGHCVVEDLATIAGLAGVHQFCRIGQMAMVGAMTKITQDVPPFMLVDGNPAVVHGVNVVGLRRNNVRASVRGELRKAYRIIYQSKLSTPHAIEKIVNELEPSPEIEHLLEFLQSSVRGIMR